MQTRWSGATGRYQAVCEQGHCALTGGRATSKREGQIFTLLDYVVGSGKQDVRIYMHGRAWRLDMVFQPPHRRPLVVEYDGAYWHRSRERADWRKARMVEDHWSLGNCVVLRIREDPLNPLAPHDVWVSSRSTAIGSVHVVLLHLMHTAPECLDYVGTGYFLRTRMQHLG
jgi:hypothetical protein